jgi:serine/threonine-protein kinase
MPQNQIMATTTNSRAAAAPQSEKKSKLPENEVIQFLRKRDYKLIKELGQGACGMTVLLHDGLIDEHFVCKKYVPYSEAERQRLFNSFVREIKLLHKTYHQNVVRVFNYYLYPEQFTGFILMEFVDGQEVDDHLAGSPEQTNEVFLQAVAGFAYLERTGILHRDIRPGNLMVREDGILKIIDFGFGKEIQDSEDFEKSISLNWWCQPPNEFQDSRYDFGTEVYFVGKLFEGIIQTNQISHFKYGDTLRRMCNMNPQYRLRSFADVEKEVGNQQFLEIDFTDAELEAYRTFADSLCRHITKIDNGAKYADDMARIVTQLNELYRAFMLERWVPDASVVIQCFVFGTYYYRKEQLAVADVRNFLHLIKSATEEKSRIVLANLHTKLDAIPRYSKEAEEADDVPF